MVASPTVMRWSEGSTLRDFERRGFFINFTEENFITHTLETPIKIDFLILWSDAE